MLRVEIAALMASRATATTKLTTSPLRKPGFMINPNDADPHSVRDSSPDLGKTRIAESYELVHRGNSDAIT